MTDAGPPPCPAPDVGPGPGLHQWADASECVGAVVPEAHPSMLAGPTMIGVVAVLLIAWRGVLR